MPQTIEERRAKAALHAREWRATHREESREYMRRYGGRYRRYKVTPEQWDEMVARYDGKCWSCREDPAEHLDHDHVTGENRGALCVSCNLGLGNFKDSPRRLWAAIRYLWKVRRGTL